LSDEILKELFSDIPEIESVVVIDEDGIVVHEYSKEGTSVDPEDIATQLVNPVRSIEEALSDSAGEECEEFIVFSRGLVIFVYKLVNETYLVAVARRSPLYGRTRFKLRSRLHKLIKAL